MEIAVRLLRYAASHRVLIAGATLAMIVYGAASAALAWLIKPIIDDVLAHQSSLGFVATGVLTAYFCKGLGAYFSSYLMDDLGHRVVMKLRNDLFRHLLGLDGPYHASHPTGDTMSRLTNDVQTVRAMWGAGVLNIVNTVFAFATVLSMMLRIDPWLTLWACLPYPMIVVAGRLFGKRIYKASTGVQAQLGALSNEIQEDLTSIAAIKTYGLERERRERDGVDRARARRCPRAADACRAPASSARFAIHPAPAHSRSTAPWATS